MITSYQYGNDLIEYAEMRDAWLAVLLPVAVAALLLLILIVYRRRRGSTTPEGLFRSWRVADAQEWLAKRFAAREQRPAAEMEKEREPIEVAAARDTSARDAEAARVTRRVTAADGAPLLHVGQRVLVEAVTTEVDDRLNDVTETGLAFFDRGEGQSRVIPWEQVRRISVRHGHERRWGIPIGLATVGAFLLGGLGWLVDEVSSSSGSNLMGIGIGLGAAVAGTFGLLIMYALPAPRWRTLVDVPAGAPPLTYATFAERSAATAQSPADVDQTSGIQVIAVVILVVVVLGTCGIFAR